MALSRVVVSRNWPVNSKINIPASMATTKVMACELPNASNAMPGPGQIPESPQPTPKIRLPVTSRRSMSRLGETSDALPETAAVRLPAIERNRACHDESRRRIPLTCQVEKSQHLALLDHSGQTKAGTEDQSCEK
jgi:hypothetical protein